MSQSIKKWLGAAGVLAMLAATGGAHAQTNGLLGEYYDVDPLGRTQPNRGLLFGCKSPVFTRVDDVVDTGFADLPEGFDPEGFGVRWSGTLTADTTEQRFIIGGSDDGIRVWVKPESQGPIKGEDAPVVDAWVDRGDTNTESATPFQFTAGQKYHVLIEFYEAGGGNAAHFRWRTTEEGATIDAVPSNLLTPAPAPPAPGTDNVAPGAVTNMTVVAASITENAADITLVAPGDDGNTAGTKAGCYEVRYSFGEITEANFAAGTQPNITLVPDPQGSTQTLRLRGLQAIERYYVGIRARDEAGNVGPIATVGPINTLKPGPPTPLPQPVPANGVTTEFFTGFGGTCVDNLKGDGRYNLDQASEIVYNPHFELYGTEDIATAPAGDLRSNIGVRMRAWFTPPKTGPYVFAGAADDDMEIAISNTAQDDPAFNALNLKGIAGNPGCDWAGVRDFTKHAGGGGPDGTPEDGTPDVANPTNRSVSSPITLTAGKKYLLQGLMKEEGGGENLAIAARDPDGNNLGTANPFDISTAGTLPIPSQYLTPYQPTPIQNGRVHFNLTDSAGKPLDGALVEVTDLRGTATVATGPNGIVSRLSPVGPISIKVLAPDPFRATLTPTAAEASETVVNETVKDKAVALAAAIPTESANVPLKSGSAGVTWTFLPTADRTVFEIDDPNTEAVETAVNYPFIETSFKSLTAAQVAAGQAHNPSGSSWVATTRAPGDVQFPDPAAAEADQLTADNLYFAYAVKFTVPAGFKAGATQFAIQDFNIDDNLHAAYLNGVEVQRSDKQTATLPGVDIWNRIWKFLVPADAVKEGENLLTLVAFQGGGGAGYTNAGLNMRLSKFGGTTPIGGCKGDANNDKKIDVNDAVAILRHATSISLLTGQNRINADIDGDGGSDAGVNVADAVKVLQFIVNIPGTGITACQ